MQTYKRPWNARATLQQDEGCTLKKEGVGGWGGKERMETGGKKVEKKRVKGTAMWDSLRKL